MMEITEVKLTKVRGDEKLKAFVSITFDDAFVVRDLKIIKGKKGEFVAMPSRKLTEHCPKCGRKNNVYSAYCGTCGEKLPKPQEDDKFKKIYADIAHPINAECRTMIQESVLEAYRNMAETDDGYSSGPAGDAGPLIDSIAADSSSDKDDTAAAADDDDSDEFSDGIW